jgi:gliding motility-associated-like protein
MKKHLYTLVLFLFPCGLFSQIQCDVDVVINEGDSIEMCADALVSISGSNGFVSYGWSGPEILTGQTITPQFSGQYIIAALDALGCTSLDTIQVTIHANPNPVLLSSEGNPICPTPGGTTLSLANSYNSYDWGGGISTPTFFASGPGVYGVTVVDENGCNGNQVISITELPFTLSADTNFDCSNTSTELEATGGTSYLWSTGETGNLIYVNPSSSTTYSVTITNGTCSQLLTQVVVPVAPFDYTLGDTIYINEGDHLLLQGPQDFVTYAWSPENEVDNPSAQNVTFIGNTTQTVFLEAIHPSGCILYDTVVVVVVKLTIPNGFSPNGDAYNNFFVIPEMESLEGGIIVWNRWGDVVLENDLYKNDWEGTCETKFCAGNGPLPEGTYFYTITVHGLEFDGYVTLKR